MHLHQSDLLPETKIMQINEIVNRLMSHEPIQYILGETYFYGLKFAVSPGVLIPRAETEELVDWIVRDEKGRSQSLLDIGTGSGCIPVSVEKNCSMTLVEGWDLSEEALEIARINAAENHARVRFCRQDIFNPTGIPGSATWDVMVSNPPYVLMEESARMEKNVLDFEPHMALFVPDHDPLIFYRAITRFAGKHLSAEGSLYFEINETMASETADLLRESGFPDVTIRKDLQGKERMVRGRRNER